MPSSTVQCIINLFYFSFHADIGAVVPDTIDVGMLVVAKLIPALISTFGHLQVQ